LGVGRITLKEAVKFHGHLGPYLILGLKAGELALEKLKCKKYFGLSVKVWGANKRPKSCLIDGLQLSTGATYGKGNIQKLKGKKIKILFSDRERGKTLALSIKENLVKQLDALKTHKDAQDLAKKLYRENKDGLIRT
jgi:formylmethanofuran dehydrogenase subunit E